MITKDLIHEAQNKWGEGIVKIGSLKNNQSECIDFTTSFLNDMYNFKNGEVEDTIQTSLTLYPSF